jgi:hypothetical protein
MRSIPPPHPRSEPAANGEVKPSVNTSHPGRLLINLIFGEETAQACENAC